MADSKKKATPAKKGKVAPRATPPKAATNTGSRTVAKTAARPAAKPAAKPATRPATKSAHAPTVPAKDKPKATAPSVSPDRPARIAADAAASSHSEELERELKEARRRIAALEEESDVRALFEEEPEVQKQLEEAQEEIRSLKTQLEQVQRSHANKAAGDEVEIEFDEEEEAPTPAEEIDDVESMYDRMDDPRVRRRELDRERMDRESEAGDEPYWLVCPKCGDSLDEIESEDVKLDRCENCGGIYMDRGEVEMLLSLSRGREGLRRVRNVLTL